MKEKSSQLTTPLKVKEFYTEEVQALQPRFESPVKDADSVRLSEDSRDVSDYVAGHVAYETKKISAGCCHNQLVSSEPANPSNKYLSLLNRGGLLFPSQELGDSVARGFALLDVGSNVQNVISKSWCAHIGGVSM